MRSLRARIAATVAAVTLLLSGAAMVAVGFALWRKAVAETPEQATNAAFELAQAGPKSIELMTTPPQRLALVVGLDDEVKVARNTADQRRLDRVIDAALDTVDLDEVGAEFVSLSDEKIGSQTWVFAALSCFDETECHAIVTAQAEPDLSSFLTERIGFGALISALLTFVALAATWWLVGRSLRPFEVMRRQLESITASNLAQRITVTKSGDEVERVGVTLNETLDRLEGAVSANERFVADAAHELRSPLTGVRLALEIENQKGSGTLIEDSLVEIDRASTIIDDLLILAKTPAQAKARQIVDLDLLVREELEALQLRHPHLRATHTATSARLLADPDGLRRAVRNLLDNAAFYGRGSVDFHATRDLAGIQVHVDDDGPGIDVAERDRVFDRFTRLDASRGRSTGGSGLGLAIVKEIVRSHGGTMAISNSPLGGARFTISFGTGSIAPEAG